MSSVRSRNAGWVVVTLVVAALVGAACGSPGGGTVAASPEGATAVETGTPRATAFGADVTPSGEGEGAGEAATEGGPAELEVPIGSAVATVTKAGEDAEPLNGSTGSTPAGEPDPSPSTASSGVDAYRELNPDGPKDANPRYYSQLLSRDAIRPIYSPTIASAEEVDLDARELVIGVSIDGETRAYPIRPLNRREMVNDVVGGVPILVTW